MLLFYCNKFNKSSLIYSKTCLKRPLKRRPKIGFQDRVSLNAGEYRLMQVKSIAECSKRAFCNTFDLHYKATICL